LLGGHLFEIHRICRRCGGDCVGGFQQWAGQKISNDMFQTWQIQKLNKFLNERQMALLLRRIGN
jgi:hypothetical protein